MKKIIVGISVFALIAIAFPVQSAGNIDVSATVTVELIAVSVDSGSVAYGTLPLNTSANTVTLNQTQTATNDGNVNIDLSIKSSDAIGGTNWNLVAAVGSLDEYTHEFSVDSGTNYASFDVNNSVYSSIAASVNPTGFQDFDLRIKTPTSTSDTLEHTITVNVLATASS